MSRVHGKDGCCLALSGRRAVASGGAEPPVTAERNPWSVAPALSGPGEPARCARRGFQGTGRLAAVLAVPVFAGGCVSLLDVDRRVDRLVVERTNLVGAGDTAPKLRHPDEGTEPRTGQADKRPVTTNPAPGELRFDPAAKNRDVVARLEGYSRIEAGARKMTLMDSWRQAQETSREFINAEEEYILSAIRLLIQRHRWGPRFFDDVTTSINSPASTGARQATLNVMNDLRVTQRLPYGGQVQAELITRAADQVVDAIGDRYTAASTLALSANLPLLRDAGLIAQEDLIQAERDLIYAARAFENFRRDFLVGIARDYLTLVAAKSSIRNQEARIRSVEKFFDQQNALIAAGRTQPFEAKNVEQELLSARNSLFNTQEAYILALDRFKIRLGLPVDEPIDVESTTIELPEPEIGVSRAAALALEYRLDYQTQRDRLDDARRQVANARNQLLPDLNVNLATTFGTDPDDPRAEFDFDLDQTVYAGSVTFGLPLDREEERLNLRSATIALQRQSRDLSQTQDTIVLEARQAVREIDRARLSVQLQEQSVTINEGRLDEVETRLRIGASIDPQKRLDAEANLLSARNERDRSIRDLQIAILDYLRVTGQLRVARTGEFQDIPGAALIEVRSAEAPPMAPAAAGDAPAPGPPGQPEPPAVDPGRLPPPVEDRPPPVPEGDQSEP